MLMSIELHFVLSDLLRRDILTDMSPWKAALSGAWRFALVSVLAFGFWAYGPKVGEGALYIGCLVSFIVFGEIFMPALVVGPNRRRRFNASFIPAFVVYAIVWSACWFALKFGAGEWLGSVLGCAAFAWILGKRLGAKTGFLAAALALILFHSAGYFLGGKAFYMARNPPSVFAGWKKQDVWTVAKLAWGFFYGIGFGAGIGYAFGVFQQPPSGQLVRPLAASDQK